MVVDIEIDNMETDEMDDMEGDDSEDDQANSEMQLPCETLDGPCMVCNVVPENDQVLLCDGCGSGWHMGCLVPPLEKAPDGDWKCVDCEPRKATSAPVPVVAVAENSIVSQVLAIQADVSLTQEEKARRIMNLHCPTALHDLNGDGDADGTNEGAVRTKTNETMETLNENLKCMICLNLVDRPVTTPCGHNSCLKCFQKAVSVGNPNCPHCRTPIPASMRSHPRINSALVTAIRLASLATNSSFPSTSGTKPQGVPKSYHPIANENRPDKCFTSERAVKTGKANAASGKIFVTSPPDHFGPIPAEHDPGRGQGVLVGESWADRLDCRQWGTHLPHVAGIAGQSNLGAQSVCLSGGYEDDEDHGEWFLYTGSGGRDLSGNKRTNKSQSFDQVFEKSNEALRLSCRQGYPVRVVRSHKEKRSSYAPGEKCVRYDGCYRIEMCWRKAGIQGYKVCRYLFVRCDNEPAPWLSDEHGDRPRPLPSIPELDGAVDITKRCKEAAWSWKEEEQAWGWTRVPPVGRATLGYKKRRKEPTVKKNNNIPKRMLREFGCVLCHRVMQLPVSTPCGHNFCKSCLMAKFAGSMAMRERRAGGERSLRAQKIKKACPTCQADITEFMTSPQVNNQLEEVIVTLQKTLENDDKAQEEKSKIGSGDVIIVGISGEDIEENIDVDGVKTDEGQVKSIDPAVLTSSHRTPDLHSKSLTSQDLKGSKISRSSESKPAVVKLSDERQKEILLQKKGKARLRESDEDDFSKETRLREPQRQRMSPSNHVGRSTQDKVGEVTAGKEQPRPRSSARLAKITVDVARSNSHAKVESDRVNSRTRKFEDEEEEEEEEEEEAKSLAKMKNESTPLRVTRSTGGSSRPVLTLSSEDEEYTPSRRVTRGLAASSISRK